MACKRSAVRSAIRLARGYTGRDRILKFAGCYHGHGDSFLVKAGSGVLTLGLPNSPGVPKALADLTITADFNDLDQVRAIFKEIGHEIAAVIVEPIAGNMNMIAPLPGFLKGLREVCDNYGSVFIVDEVMTGFRVAMGGAQEVYGVTPDLTTFGKVIGAGMPVGAYGGKREIMEKIAPLGPVYIEKAGMLDRITMHHRPALEVIPTLPAPFDLVVIDADKNNYPNYYDAVIERVRPGGLIIADNVLWSGKVLRPTQGAGPPNARPGGIHPPGEHGPARGTRAGAHARR